MDLDVIDETFLTAFELLSRNKGIQYFVYMRLLLPKSYYFFILGAENVA